MARGAGRAGEGGATGSLALLFLCGILVTLILSIFGNKARATNFLRVLFFYISAFFFFVVVERGDIRFFEIVNSDIKKRKKEKIIKCCIYNSINYIEAIKKEKYKPIFVTESA